MKGAGRSIEEDRVPMKMLPDVKKELLFDTPRAQIEATGLRFHRKHLTTHRVLKRTFDLRPGRFVVDLC